MIKRVLVVSMVGLSLVGCVNNDTLSGDVYTASEAKQVQNVSYGTIVVKVYGICESMVTCSTKYEQIIMKVGSTNYKQNIHDDY